MADKRIIMVIGDSPACHWLREKLRELGHVNFYFVEDGGEGWRFYWKKLKRVGILTFLFQWKLNREYKARITKELPYSDHGLHYGEIEHLSISDRGIIGGCCWMKIRSGDLFFCFGTSIIPTEILERIRFYGAEIVNLHTGFLPYYRGVKSEFWAIKNKDYERIGATIHQMTEKIDGGKILKRWNVSIATNDPIVARIILMKKSLVPVEVFLRGWMNGGDFHYGTHSNSGGKYYTTPTRKEWNEVANR